MKTFKTAIIFDLEATCEDKKITEHYDNETIEIGAVKMVNGQIVDEFQRFIKPVRTPKLTSFCTNLTKITQEEVDRAMTFPEAIQKFQEWAGEDAEYLSWGFYDRKQFEKDCRYHNLSTDWLASHRSLKHEHQVKKNLKRPVGVLKALSLEGVSFSGTHHRGIDDAKNIAQIYLRVLTQQ